LHHTGPPLGLSRDLIIRGSPTSCKSAPIAARAGSLQRRVQILAAEFDKGARSFDPGRVLKSGATLVRQWRGHTHTVLVQEDGFEYDGQRYHQGSGPILVPFGEFSNVRFTDGKSGSHLTHRWRKTDSNSQSRSGRKGYAVGKDGIRRSGSKRR